MPTTFPTDNVTPRLISVSDSLTRASIRGFTKQDFEDQQYKEVGLDRVIAATKEARMAGVKAKSMMDLVLSRMRPQKMADYPSIIQPYRLVPRRNQVNVGFFQVESGAAHPSAGQVGYHSGLWNLTVNLGSSPWVGNSVTLPSGATMSTGSQGVKNLEKFFLPGQYIHVEWSSGNVAKSMNFKVVNSANATTGGVEKATVTVEPCYTTERFAALADKADYQPTVGQVNMLANSVSNYESWGYQKPAWNDRTLLEFWKQTLRWCHSYNEEYVKALAAPYTSDFFKKFQSLPLAEQRKLQQQQIEEEIFNTFWFGNRINENQTISSWLDLPDVESPANAGLIIEKKSNTLGVFTQLYNAGMVQDKQAGALSLADIFVAGYYLRRLRGAERIDLMTDRYTKGRIRTAMHAYYKSKYGISDITMYAQPGKKIEFNGMVVFEYDLYDIPDENYQLAVFTDDFFDDRIAQFNAALKARGRMAVMVDWSDVYVNLISSMSVKRVTDEYDELFRYVMTPVIHHTQLNSQTIEVQVQDPNRSLIIHNFDDSTPALP